MTWSIDYADGSANVYRFRPDHFEYDPVTPERSSTGMYSGGPPRSGGLDATTLATLWAHVRALETSTSLHVEDRGKGTGAFTIVEGADTRRFIIARGTALAAFDSFVASL